MSKSERIKEEIGWLKVVFGLLVAIDVSLVAWIVQNFTRVEPALPVVAGLMVVIVSGAVIWINRVVYRRLDQLEDL